MSGGPRKVLFVGLYASMGGAERALLELTSSLDPSRFAPLVVLGEDGPLATKLQAAGVETRIERFPAPPLWGLASPPTVFRLLRVARRIDALARERGVGLLQCGDVLSLLLLRRAGGARRPLVYQINYLGARPRRTLLRLLGGRIDAIVCCSEFQRRASAALALAAPASVIAPGINPVAFEGGRRAALRRELGIPDDAPVVGMLGRYDVWKGHRVFLKAAAQVLRKHPKARFVVAGGAVNPLRHISRYQARVRVQAEALALGPSLALLGHRDDVPDVLAGLDVLVCPSIDEPFGMVLLEAMAAGRPVIASDSGGPLEIVEHDRTGVLFRTGDADALAAATLGLLEDPARAARLAAAGRARVRDAYHRSRYARDMQALYDRLA